VGDANGMGRILTGHTEEAANVLRILCCTKGNPLHAELNIICHLLALLGGAIIVVVNRLRVKGKKDVSVRTN
jgi:hypothetical protein